MKILSYSKKIKNAFKEVHWNENVLSILTSDSVWNEKFTVFTVMCYFFLNSKYYIY